MAPEAGWAAEGKEGAVQAHSRCRNVVRAILSVGFRITSAIDFPASTSQVMRLQACGTTPALCGARDQTQAFLDAKKPSTSQAILGPILQPQTKPQPGALTRRLGCLRGLSCVSSVWISILSWPPGLHGKVLRWGEGLIHFPPVLDFVSLWWQEGSCLLPRSAWFQSSAHPAP